MPPRVPGLQCLKTFNGPPSLFASRSFSLTPSSQASTVAQRRRRRDPYAIAQARARKAANISRQEVLQKERAGALGDPVRGISTPFLESFDTAEPLELAAASKDSNSQVAESGDRLNFFLSKDELAKGMEHSRWLSTPPASDIDPASEPIAEEINRASSTSTADAQSSQPDWYGRMIHDTPPSTKAAELQRRNEKLQEDQDTATEALKRISSLSLGSSKDRLRVNIQRCINVFGRHATDSSLPPKAPSTVSMPDSQQLGKTPRVGPDTGSSEVQIAILTAKIRTLADFLELRGGHDKANKRNLRLLVHRRAKLLKYLRKKERGGPRWQHLIETLGLTEGTWKEQISI